jgi:hypothetical protein
MRCYLTRHRHRMIIFRRHMHTHTANHESHNKQVDAALRSSTAAWLCDHTCVVQDHYRDCLRELRPGLLGESVRLGHVRGTSLRQCSQASSSTRRDTTAGVLDGGEFSQCRYSLSFCGGGPTHCGVVRLGLPSNRLHNFTGHISSIDVDEPAQPLHAEKRSCDLPCGMNRWPFAHVDQLCLDQPRNNTPIRRLDNLISRVGSDESPVLILEP